MAEPSLLMVLVYALRHDDVAPGRTPFLWEVARGGSRGATQEIFAGQLRPAFFAGLYPNESGVGHLFCYDPASSPFRLARLAPSWVDRSARLSFWARRAIEASARRVEARRGHRGSASACTLAEIPTTRLPSFAFSERHLPWEDRASPRPGLLSILSALRLPWLHLGYPVIDQRTSFLTEAALSRMRASHRFVFLHYAQLDWAGHTHGPHGPEASAALEAIDRSLEAIWRHAQALWAEPRLLVFGDHGMVPVRAHVNVEQALDELPLRVGKDYVVFLDSTVARFWFHAERARALIVDRLEGLPHGHWLTASDLEALHLDGGKRENGEAFWLLDEGVVIMPSYFQRKVPPLGMHGYHPSVEANWGGLVTNDPYGPSGPIPLTDVFRLAFRLLGLESARVFP